MKEDNLKSVVIYSGTLMEVSIVKNMLENAEISAFVKDGISGTIAPWINEAGGMGAVKLIVLESDQAKAKQVVDEFFKNRSIEDNTENADE